MIWLEHVEVEGGGVHSIYKPLIRAGLAFGAQRWLAILDGYCQRIANGSVPLDVIGFLGIFTLSYSRIVIKYKLYIL